MSNTRKPSNPPTSLARYRSEVKGDPFVLWVDDDTKVEVPRPTSESMWDAEEATTSREAIRALGGAKGDELVETLAGEDIEVMVAVLNDMRKHFGVGE